MREFLSKTLKKLGQSLGERGKNRGAGPVLESLVCFEFIYRNAKRIGGVPAPGVNFPAALKMNGGSPVFHEITVDRHEKSAQAFMMRLSSKIIASV